MSLATYSSVRLQVDKIAASSLPPASTRSNQARAAITAWPSWSGAKASCSRSETGAVVWLRPTASSCISGKERELNVHYTVMCAGIAGRRRCSGAQFFQAVTVAVDRHQPETVFRLQLQFVAHARNVGVHGARRDHGFAYPDGFVDVGARQRPADVAEKQQREKKLLVRHVQHGAVHQQAAGAGLEHVLAELQLLGAVLARIGAPQQGLHARHQLAAAQRLDHIVVGAGLHAGDDVILAGTGGQEQHRRVVGQFVAAAAQHFGAGQVGHLPVEDQHVVAVLAQLAQQVLAGLEAVADVAGGGENLAYQVGLAAIVVKYGDSHVSLECRAADMDLRCQPEMLRNSHSKYNRDLQNKFPKMANYFPLDMYVTPCAGIFFIP